MTDEARPTTREDCVLVDQNDELAALRDEFALPADIIYLDGNSLGALPKAAAERAAFVVGQEWGTDLIGSWNKHHWFDLPVRIGEKINRLIGGGDGECVVTDTTSINVFKAMSCALALQRDDAPTRRVIVSERENFPTDLYMAEGLIAQLGDGYRLRLIDEPDDLDDALDDDVAVVLLTEVNYRTGRLWDMGGDHESDP